jgi:hypothetical protein
MGANNMVRFTFGLLTPLMFLFSVMMYLGDFRLVAVAFAAAGCCSHWIGGKLTSNS